MAKNTKSAAAAAPAKVTKEGKLKEALSDGKPHTADALVAAAGFSSKNSLYTVINRLRRGGYDITRDKDGYQIKGQKGRKRGKKVAA